MDTRKEKTHKKIKDTYLKLIKKKDPSHISAIELCEAAEINRSTFYDHFGYMDGLVNEVIRDQVNIICNMEGVEKVATSDENGHIPRQVIEKIVNNYLNNEIIQIFLKSDRSNVYNQIIMDEQTKRTMVKLNCEFCYLRVYFMNVGLFMTLSKWLSSNKKMPIEKLIDIAYDYSIATYK
ncbi:MAG: TetR/AcrR family transcriptional regulator [Erysipelotrichaceae bacterium]|nr:TetR/AcrR family transcriptional regulator [Erysipelotrichaceae bacterium]